MNKIGQLGNLIKKSNYSNPQVGRVYSIFGLCPTLNTCGGGQREPKVIVIESGEANDINRRYAKTPIN